MNDIPKQPEVQRAQEHVAEARETVSYYDYMSRASGKEIRARERDLYYHTVRTKKDLVFPVVLLGIGLGSGGPMAILTLAGNPVGLTRVLMGVGAMACPLVGFAFPFVFKLWLVPKLAVGSIHGRFRKEREQWEQEVDRRRELTRQVEERALLRLIEQGRENGPPQDAHVVLENETVQIGGVRVPRQFEAKSR